MYTVDNAYQVSDFQPSHLHPHRAAVNKISLVNGATKATISSILFPLLQNAIFPALFVSMSSQYRTYGFKSWG
jgi:hypothetical protein